MGDRNTQKGVCGGTAGCYNRIVSKVVKSEKALISGKESCCTNVCDSLRAIMAFVSCRPILMEQRYPMWLGRNSRHCIVRGGRMRPRPTALPLCAVKLSVMFGSGIIKGERDMVLRK